VIPNDRGKIFKGFSDWLLRLLSSLLGKCIESLAQAVSFHFLLKSNAGDSECQRCMRYTVPVFGQDLRNVPRLLGRSRVLQ
jgi:hypothetical protein